MVDYTRGRWPSSKELPSQISEFYLAREFGWTLEYIRKLKVSDFRIMLQLLSVYNRVKGTEKT